MVKAIVRPHVLSHVEIMEHVLNQMFADVTLDGLVTSVKQQDVQVQSLKSRQRYIFLPEFYIL